MHTLIHTHARWGDRGRSMRIYLLTRLFALSLSLSLSLAPPRCLLLSLTRSLALSLFLARSLALSLSRSLFRSLSLSRSLARSLVLSRAHARALFQRRNCCRFTQERQRPIMCSSSCSAYLHHMWDKSIRGSMGPTLKSRPTVTVDPVWGARFSKRELFF
jgi:hypothetical protein